MQNNKQEEKHDNKKIEQDCMLCDKTFLSEDIREICEECLEINNILNNLQ